MVAGKAEWKAEWMVECWADLTVDVTVVGLVAEEAGLSGGMKVVCLAA